MRRALLLLLLVVLGLLWSLTIPLNKIAVSAGHSVTGLVLWQLVVLLVCFGTVLLARRHFPYSRSAIAYVALIGVLGTALPHSFSFLATAELPASSVAVAIASVPMFAFAIAVPLRLDRFSGKRLLGLALGLGAILLLLAEELTLPQAGKAVFVAVALIAPLCYALEGLSVDRLNSTGLDPVSTLFGAALVGILLVAPAAVATGGVIDPLRAWGRAEWALTASAGIHAVSYGGYIWLIGAGGPIFASQIAYVVTLGGVVFSMWLLGEARSGYVIGALLLMLAGLSLVLPRPKSGLAAPDGRSP